MYILYVIYTLEVVVNKRIEKLYFMNWLGLGLGFRKVVYVPMLAVPDIRLTPGFNEVASSKSLLRTLSVVISISTVSVFVVVSSSPEVFVSNLLVISVSRGASVESDDGDEDG